MTTSHLEKIARTMRAYLDPECRGTPKSEWDNFRVDFDGVIDCREFARAILALPPSPDARNAALEDAAKKFVAKVENGLARSTESYNEFKAALALQSPRAETPEAEDQDVITMPTEAFNKFREALENPKEPTEALKRLFREPTREEARALTDAGYMPVSEYVRLFGEGR